MVLLPGALDALSHVAVVCATQSLLSAYASRRRALAFDGIPFAELSKAYAEHLAKLFLHESDLDLRPPELLLRLFRLRSDELAASEDLSAVSVRAAEAAVDRERVVVGAVSARAPARRLERAPSPATRPG